MAACGKRALHSKGFYRSLDRLSSADFTQQSRLHRKTVDSLTIPLSSFDYERVTSE